MTLLIGYLPFARTDGTSLLSNVRSHPLVISDRLRMILRCVRYHDMDDHLAHKTVNLDVDRAFSTSRF